jgi:hypothetical protein
MKLILFLLFVSSLASWARLDDMSHFSSALMEDVKRDVKNNNAEDLKEKSEASRGPASVESPLKEGPEVKSEKLNQLGTKKW